MSAPLHLDADGLRRALPMAAAIDALAAGIGVRRDDPLRSRMATAGGELLLMPAAGPEGVGVKLVGVAPGNAQRGLPTIGGLYVLLDAETLQPRATIDGAAITVLRTAALSGLATRLLARETAWRVALFGTGPQAIGHAEAMCAVRPVESIAVVGRVPERAQAAVEAIRAAVAPYATDERHAPEVEAAFSPRGALAGADIVCTCTSATEPLFDSDDLPDGAHVNAIGSHRPQDAELDAATVARALVVVEDRTPAWAEAGELVAALQAGVIDRHHVVADLAELAGGAVVRTGDADVTLFKAVGAAFEDLIVAAAAVAAI